MALLPSSTQFAVYGYKMLTVAYDESVKGPVDFQPDYIMLDVLY